MRITLVMVESLDGKTTKDGESPNFWASAEDQEHFEVIKSDAKVIIMGRNTYDAGKSGMIYRDNLLRIVMTRKEAEPRKGFEFNDKNPKDLLVELENRGYEEAILVGGSEVNASFFKDKLINDIYLTIEPKLFGIGLPLAQLTDIEVELELINIKQMNSKGTLLLHYNVK